MEAELKLRVADPTCLNSLLQAPLLRQLSTQPPYTQMLETTYYDTADQRLLKSRLSYRLRLAGGEWTATVKADGTSDGGLHQRTEYNISVDNPLPSLEPFLTTNIGPRLTAAVGNMSLEPIFCTRFARHILNLTAPDGSQIELALDDGDIVAGNKQQKLLELELELKAGQPHALIWLGAALAEDFPLLPEQNSKLYRATVLAGLTDGLEQDTPLSCPLKKANAAQPVDQILSQFMIYHIHRAISAQQTYLVNPDHRETVTQFRLALEKLHALLKFIEPLLPSEESLSWLTRLATWQDKLDRICDLDAFILGWNELTLSREKILATTAGKPTITSLVENKLRIAKDSFYAEVATGQCTPVLLGLWAFMEDWPTQHPPETATCKKFVRERLTYWLNGLFSQGDEFDPTSPTATCELRLAAKRLRYALDSLTPILPGSTGLLSRRLEQLQDLLGRMRDISFTLPLLQELVKASASRLTHYDSGLVTGWQLARATTVLNDWKRMWTKVKKAAYHVKKLRPVENDIIYRRSPEL